MKKKMKSIPSLPLLFFFLLLLSRFSTAFSRDKYQAYIVYKGEHSGLKTAPEILEDHLSNLISVKSSEEEAHGSLLYSYKNSINGFGAFLSKEEAKRLSELEGIVSVFKSRGGTWGLQTTRSWKFIAHEEGLTDWEAGRMPAKAKYGKDVIVGMLDSGIWPESKSFSDVGMGPMPKRWKGICEAGESFNSSNCNRKIIGARYYLKGYEAHYGRLNTSSAFRSPRDHDSHGTHTSSTVAGRVVPGVSALGGFGRGTASGGAPLARLAVYKVCWSIPGPNPNLENTCFDVDMLAAIDDAIGDGVDVLSISIGAVGKPSVYSKDGIAIGTLHAAKRNIVVVLSGGNSGPTVATVTNLAPWMITVAASGTDRNFYSRIVLGNGKKIEGQTVTPYKLKKGVYSLIYAGDASVPGTPTNATGQCLPDSLSMEKVKGKIVLCFRGAGMRVSKGMEVKRAGGTAMILGNAAALGNEVVVDAHVLPAAAVTANDANAILQYIKSTAKPVALLDGARTFTGIKTAPVMTAFSARGPNVIEPNILKPDVTAPGLNILAAWSEAVPPTKIDGDARRVKYSFMSGTSMACPHISSTAALLKSLHPHWSSAAIRSAIMTTAATADTEGTPIKNPGGDVAGPMDYGSGHVRPTHAADPGLVYDATYHDYLMFACASIGAQMDHAVPCPKSPPSASDLNYPSLAVSGLNGTATIHRKVTNVGRGGALYKVKVVEPGHVSVDIEPKVLWFEKAGATRSFKVTFKAKSSARSGKYMVGSYTWSDGTHHVRSPIVVSVIA